MNLQHAAVNEATPRCLGTSASAPEEERSRVVSATPLMMMFVLMPTTGSALAVPRGLLLSMPWQTGAGLVAEEEPSTAAADVMELRRLTGLTWEQLAQLFGVARRSVHFWASGQPLTREHRLRLGRLLSVIRRLDRGASDINREALLFKQRDGVVPFELLVEGRFEEVLMRLGSTPAVHRRSPSPVADPLRLAASPDQLVGALQDRVHIERGRLLKTIPLRSRKGA